DGPAFEQIGEGYFAILIDQGPNKTPHQGITPLTAESLAACTEAYFTQSEQIPTRFSLSFGRSKLRGEAEQWRAGGMILQHMPKASPHAKGEGGSGAGGLIMARDLVEGDAEEDWDRVNILLDTVEHLELIGPAVAPTDLLVRL